MTSISSRYPVLQAIGRPAGRRRRAAVFVVATVIAGIAALALGLWLAGDLSYSYIFMMAVGGSSSVAAWGLPVSKLAMDLSSIGVIGLLLACLLLPGHDRELGDTAQRCLRTARWLAPVWSVSTAALLMFSWSDATALPVTALPVGRLFTHTATTFPDAAGYLTSTALALVITGAVFSTRTRRGALILLPVAVYGLVPMTLEGNASHSAVIEWSMVVHVTALSLWVGGLAALVMHARGEPAALAVAVPRFSTLALACYLAVAVSGIIGAWEMLGYSVSPLWGSRYGILVILKAAALIALGILGWWQRRYMVRRIRTGEGSRTSRAFIRLAAAEIIIMVVAAALGVALSRTASPDVILDHSGSDVGAISFVHTQPGIRT